MTVIKPLLVTLLVAIGSAASAAQTPVASPVDPRIRTVVYNPREVVTITGQPGYQMVIAFGPGERIENVSIGDSQAWQATPNRKADLLFLKPIDSIASTNMTVVTNARRYNFELIVQSASMRRNQTFDIRFIYPNEELAAGQTAAGEPLVSDALPPESWNFAYSYTGDKSNLPSRVFDDGRFTYFQWPAGIDTPAVFAVGADGKESLVNHIVKGRYFVVEQLAGQFVLRSGPQVTKVFNDALRAIEPGAAAPRPREARSRKRGLFG
ncbi:P-type conjugative transfer protein VirB9 [Sandarakinorhabdus limnophila]|uniref:P-type conjugative transfer protein VirB9 n=1 Tax=Sandarakinorhabdus limnophila TaxID=210512 RepID=UPI0003B5EC12|nr:P-type conjugative transfer protein VirB9 [Sandarakinorhabdus limnophila]